MVMIGRNNLRFRISCNLSHNVCRIGARNNVWRRGVGRAGAVKGNLNPVDQKPATARELAIMGTVRGCTRQNTVVAIFDVHRVKLDARSKFSTARDGCKSGDAHVISYA